MSTPLKWHLSEYTATVSISNRFTLKIYSERGHSWQAELRYSDSQFAHTTLTSHSIEPEEARERALVWARDLLKPAVDALLVAVPIESSIEVKLEPLPPAPAPETKYPYGVEDE